MSSQSIPAEALNAYDDQSFIREDNSSREHEYDSTRRPDFPPAEDLPSIQVGNAPHSRFCANHLSLTILVYYHLGNGARSQNPAHFPKLSGIIWEWGPFSLVTL